MAKKHFGLTHLRLAKPVIDQDKSWVFKTYQYKY